MTINNICPLSQIFSLWRAAKEKKNMGKENTNGEIKDKRRNTGTAFV